MADIESKVLTRELGRLAGWFGGSWGARWAARRLPSVSFETRFELEESPAVASTAVEALLSKIGRRIPELDSHPNAGRFHVLVGSGHLNLNPTIVRIELQSTGSQTSVYIRAVAKEGVIKQDSARLAVEKIKAALSGGPS